MPGIGSPTQTVTRLPNHADVKVIDVRSGEKNDVTYLAENLVSFLADEVAPFVEVIHPKCAPLVKFWTKSSSDIDDCPEHLIVAVPCEQDFAGIELVQRAPDGPHVNGIVVRHTQYDLRSTVESAD